MFTNFEMNENLFDAQYNVTKKSKLSKFYESNKVLIYSVISILIISLASIIFYLEKKEKEKTLLAESYIEAVVYSKNGDRNKAVNILREVIFANDSTYSTLSLFLILNENLILEKEELLHLFNHVLKENKFEKEVRNLIIFKKALFQSNLVNESELLEAVNPLINTETLWKPHALLLLGDYFFSKRQYFKAREFYTQVLSLKNLHKELYEQAKFQLSLIINE